MGVRLHLLAGCHLTYVTPVQVPDGRCRRSMSYMLLDSTTQHNQADWSLAEVSLNR